MSSTKSLLSVLSKSFVTNVSNDFTTRKILKKHDCAKVQVRPENKNKAIIKDIAHHLKAEFCKGIKHKLVARLTNTTSEERAAHIRDLHNNPRYVIYDLETDTHTLTHKPNHCEVEILKTHHTHDYEKSIVGRKTFEGYGCEHAFCEWLFQEENENSTVIAHNGAGYDSKFILKWSLGKGWEPTTFIRQGSRITNPAFRKQNIRFIDSYHVTLQGMSKIPKTNDLRDNEGELLGKVYFPHHFNTDKNQNYIGSTAHLQMKNTESRTR